MQTDLEVKDYIKTPFANYDIVVYFGCGLFSLSFIFHYFVEPLGLRFPRFAFEIGNPFADSTISILTLLFTVYILGHMIAYVASHAVEKTIDIFFGKVSSAILISNYVPKEKFTETIQAYIWKKTKEAFRHPHRISSSLRVLFLLPVLPTIVFLFLFRQLEYFRSRIPPLVFSQVRKECMRRGFGSISLKTKWYKAIEHDVINNDPLPLSRMYNYLIIAGIFRSLALIFLMCAWAELYFEIHLICHGDEIVKSLMSDRALPHGHVLAIVGFNILFGFSLSAYLKFSRRYVEEAIFSFVMSK